MMALILTGEAISQNVIDLRHIDFLMLQAVGVGFCVFLVEMCALVVTFIMTEIWS